MLDRCTQPLTKQNGCARWNSDDPILVGLSRAEFASIDPPFDLNVASIWCDIPTSNGQNFASYNPFVPR